MAEPKRRIATCAVPGCGNQWMTRAFRLYPLYCHEHRHIPKKLYYQRVKSEKCTGMPAGRPSKGVAAILRTCKQCGEYIKAERKSSEFCSNRCTSRHYLENRVCKPGGYAICGPGW